MFSGASCGLRGRRFTPLARRAIRWFTGRPRSGCRFRPRRLSGLACRLRPCPGRLAGRPCLAAAVLPLAVLPLARLCRSRRRWLPRRFSRLSRLSRAFAMTAAALLARRLSRGRSIMPSARSANRLPRSFAGPVPWASRCHARPRSHGRKLRRYGRGQPRSDARWRPLAKGGRCPIATPRSGPRSKLRRRLATALPGPV